jgi:hypothetical protein
MFISSGSIDMATSPITADSDWELFSIDDEDDDTNISLEEMSRIHQISSVPDYYDDSFVEKEGFPTSKESPNLSHEDDTGAILNDELIKLEDLCDSYITPTQPRFLAIESLDHQSTASPPCSTADLDQLHNLPLEIVERARSFSFLLH